MGTLIEGSRCATLWYKLDLTFDLAELTPTFKILSGLYLEDCNVVMCGKFIAGRDLGRVVVQRHCVTLI